MPDSIMTAEVGMYIIFALTAAVIIIWLVLSFSKSKGLVNHPNAVCLRAFVNFLRTTEKEGNQLNTLYEILTKKPNDIAMLFYMYCRIHNNFSYIEHYLNYRTYKRINTKQKPWGMSIIIVFALINASLFGISYYVGLENFINVNFELTSLLQALALPFLLCIVWLSARVMILMKYKMYWVEFENLFRKASISCGSFFSSQESYFEEFSENILSGLMPRGGVKRRIELIIATTNAEALEQKRFYVSHATQKGKNKTLENAQSPAPTVTASETSKMLPQQMPAMPGVRILKPHPETEAYMQAQAQITTQLMQMMMQQSMQQSQVIQRALSSQQALANSVVQQNIMAMRLEAQQTSLLRPDLAKRISEQTYTWPSKTIPEQEAVKEFHEAEIETVEETNVNKTEDGVVDEVLAAESTEVNENIAVNISPKDERAIMASKVQEAFELLAPPPKADKEPDPTFPEPDRELTNVEKRLAQLFAAKVYIYD